MRINRSQKKCFAASIGLHLLLGGILIFGPAFLTPERKALRPGLSNSAEPPVGQVFTLVPEPAFAAPLQPSPAAQASASAPAQPQASTPAPNASRNKPVASTERNAPTRNAKPSSPRSASRDNRAEQIDKILKDIRERTSPATKVELKINVSSSGGGGDDAYAQFVRQAYTTKWDLSGADAASDSTVVKVGVTIAKDGSVVESKIISFSGNADVDKSVERTLGQVNMIRPFEDGAMESQRTYTINFRCNAKGN
jgi:hypothetical protein